MLKVRRDMRSYLVIIKRCLKISCGLRLFPIKIKFVGSNFNRQVQSEFFEKEEEG